MQKNIRDTEAERLWRVALVSLGCKTNHYESSALAEQFRQAGFKVVAADEAFDCCLVNTCTVTAEAGRKSCQTLRRLKRAQPEALMVAMGCHAQLEDLSDICDFSVGTSGRTSILELLKERLTAKALAEPLVSTKRPADEPFGPSRARQFEELGTALEQAETRAEIKIEDGCDQFCTYCAICLARGRVRSRSREAIVTEAKALLAAGFRELVLTGIHICSFEAEKGRDSLALLELLEELEQLPGLLRLRLGSLEPASLTPQFIERLGHLQKLCPQFHLSLQSGSDKILEKMHRSYDSRRYREVVQGLRSVFQDPALTTDVMVAFPYEDDACFQESYDFVREMGFARIHVFRYSPRAKTPAAKWPRPSVAVARERSEKMQALGAELARQYAERQIGRDCTLILEQEIRPAVWSGYSEHYLSIELQGEYHSGEVLKLTLAREHLPAYFERDLD